VNALPSSQPCADTVLPWNHVTVSSELPSSQTACVDDHRAVTADTAAGCEEHDGLTVLVRDTSREANMKLSDLAVSDGACTSVFPTLTSENGASGDCLRPAVDCLRQNKDADEPDTDSLATLCTDKIAQTAGTSRAPATEVGRVINRTNESPCTAASELVQTHIRAPEDDGTPLSSLNRRVFTASFASKHNFKIFARFWCVVVDSV